MLKKRVKNEQKSKSIITGSNNSNNSVLQTNNSTKQYLRPKRIYVMAKQTQSGLDSAEVIIIEQATGYTLGATITDHNGFYAINNITGIKAITRNENPEEIIIEPGHYYDRNPKELHCQPVSISK